MPSLARTVTRSCQNRPLSLIFTKGPSNSASSACPTTYLISHFYITFQKQTRIKSLTFTIKMNHLSYQLKCQKAVQTANVHTRFQTDFILSMAAGNEIIYIYTWLEPEKDSCLDSSISQDLRNIFFCQIKRWQRHSSSSSSCCRCCYCQ